MRWPYRAESRALAHTAYVKQFQHATQYLKDSPLFTIGLGTGTLRVRGDLAAPGKGQTLALDKESLFQHLLGGNQSPAFEGGVQQYLLE